MSDDLKSQRENGRIVVNVMKSIGSAASLRRIQDAVLANMVGDFDKKSALSEIASVVQIGVDNGFLHQIGKNYAIEPADADTQKEAPQKTQKPAPKAATQKSKEAPTKKGQEAATKNPKKMPGKVTKNIATKEVRKTKKPSAAQAVAKKKKAAEKKNAK